jgi:hypothetical protein
MSKADPFKFAALKHSFDTMYRALKDGEKQPFIGLTQGGSSRKFAGCKSAASRATVRQPTEKKLG